MAYARRWTSPEDAINHRAPPWAAALLALAGCTQVGVLRIPAPTAPETTTEPPRAPVLLVVVEDLRADVLAAYLEDLQREEGVPGHPTGLGLLMLDDFELVVAERAEAPLPPVPLVAAATLATGQLPGVHGVLGDDFVHPTPGEALVRVDLGDARDAARVWYGPAFAPPTPDDPPLLAALAAAPTLYERVGARGPAVAVFDPVGRGASWLVPDRALLATSFLLQGRAGAWAAPMLDRGGREAAIDVLLDAERPPALLSLWFREVAAATGALPDATCLRAPAPLFDRQRAALARVDAQLAAVLGKLRAAHPDAFGDLRVVLTGTGGAVDRAGAPAGTALTPAELVDRLGSADAACGQHLRAAHDAGDLLVSANGAAAWLHLAPRTHGARPDAARRCLGTTLAGATATAPYLAGAAWRGADGVQSALAPDWTAGLSAHRAARLPARLTQALASARGAEALLFLRAPWVLVPHAETPGPLVVRGGLEDEALAVPLVVASRSLGVGAARALRTLPAELTDVAPTVLALIGVDPADLPRPPLLAWTGGDRPALQVPVAERAPRAAPPLVSPHLVWEESVETALVGLEEPAALWGPESVTIRLGDRVHRWQGAEGFSTADCRFEEDATRRRWTCTLALDRAGAPLLPVAVRRTPGPYGPEPLDVLAPVLPGGAPPALVTEPEVVCADAERVRVSLRADGPLSRIGVHLVTDPAARLPTLRSGAAVLEALQPGEACAADPTAPTCGFALPPPFAGTVDVPFSAAHLAHIRATARVAGAPAPDREALRARLPAAAPKPRDAVLTLRVCDHAGRCTDRPLLADTEYAERIERGCP